MNYTTVDRIFATLARDLKGTNLSESDVIEWIGEALDFMQVYASFDQAVAFLEVRNYHTDLPKGFQGVLQIARDTHWQDKGTNCGCAIEEVIAEVLPGEDAPCPVVTDCHGNLIGNYEYAYYRPKFDLQWEYSLWTNSSYYQQRYTPIRLANKSLFGELVYRERNEENIYRNAVDTYTIVGTVDRKLRFDFENGFIALSYLRTAIDEISGYPLIPDDVSVVTAIKYYIKWKVAEWYSWNGRQGFTSEAERAEARWMRYVKQSKNKMKMPKTLDEFQNILELTHRLVPDYTKYYSYFGASTVSTSRTFTRQRNFLPPINGL